jgi:general secretion pathway protein L
VRAVLRLRVSRDLVRAEVVRWRKTLWAAEARYSGPEDLCTVIGQLSADLPPRCKPGRLRVELDPKVVQLRTVSGLPPVRRAALKRLVSLQSSRFFRRNGTPLITDACWAARGRRGGAAVAVALEETFASSIVAASREIGIALEGIGVTGNQFDLLPPRERTARRRAEMLSVRRLACLLALTWVAGGAAFVAQLHVEGQRMERELEALRQPVAAVARARREIAEAAAMVELVAQAEAGREETLARLAAIAMAIPDSAYLTSIALDTAGGTMSGRARESAGVVAALDRRGAVAGARLEGAAVRELAGGKEWERFSIRFGRGDK